MKIVYFSRSFMPSHEANSIHVINMCEALKDLGHDVLLLCPNRGHSEEEIFNFYGTSNRFKILFLPYPSVKGKALIYAMSSIRELKNFKPDLVISRFLYGGLLATALKLPVIQDLHGDEWSKKPLFRAIFKRLTKAPSLKKLTFNSYGLKRRFIASGLNANVPMEVLHNGAKSMPLDEKIDLPGNNEFKAGYFGNLYKGRGIELLIEVASKVPSIDFIIVGGAPRDISYWKRMELPLNFHLLGFIEPKLVHKYRNSVQVLLAPYSNEVSMARNSGNSVSYMNPLKIIEYMGSKKVIIASDLPAIREVLNETNSVLLSNLSPHLWAEALTKISNDYNQYYKLAEKAYEGFQGHYTWTSRAASMIGSQ